MRIRDDSSSTRTTSKQERILGGSVNCANDSRLSLFGEQRYSFRWLKDSFFPPPRILLVGQVVGGGDMYAAGFSCYID